MEIKSVVTASNKVLSVLIASNQSLKIGLPNSLLSEWLKWLLDTFALD